MIEYILKRRLFLMEVARHGSSSFAGGAAVHVASTRDRRVDVANCKPNISSK
jgi:hypothetical protein